MKIAVIGTGYVGLVTGACFAEMGNSVWCVDTDTQKIQNLTKGVFPIYEPGLEKIVQTNIKLGQLHFTVELSEALSEATVCFIAVGTPMAADGSADLRYVTAAAKSIGAYMVHHTYIVDKSTVPVGTANLVRQTVQSVLEQRGSDLTFDVISNPEFLKEGTAVQDCMKPDRVVLGVDNAAAAEVMKELYHPYVRNTENLLVMDIPSAEMTKYAANSMLATKISFINEISNICEQVGADVNQVRLGIGSDSRIGYSFIFPGCGYGGSCFPKDVQALIAIGRSYGYDAALLEAVERVNYNQKRVLCHKIKSRFGENLYGKRFAVWGLAFKPDTNDMREAPAITIIRELVENGAEIVAYDPQAADEAKSFYLKDIDCVTYAPSKYEAVIDADALLLITEWKEFRQPDFAKLHSLMRHPIIFDGRNQYNQIQLAKLGIEYHQIGVQPC